MVPGVPQTQYAKTDDGVFLAYQAFGDGPACFVGLPPVISNIETIWEYPESARFLDSLASFCRVVLYDKRGQGMSDRVDEVPTLERRAADTRAVMDAAGVDRAVIGGISEGGSAAAMFAATYPERVSGLLLFGTFARAMVDDDYPMGANEATFSALCELWPGGWGTPDSATVALVVPDRLGDAQFLQFMNRYERTSSTPRGLHDQLQWAKSIDVRSILPIISAPTLVLHRQGDRLVPVAHGRWLAEHIAGARYVELPGSEHVPFFGDIAAVLDEMEQFITGQRGHATADRVLATVVFTDIVASTERAQRAGDRDWRALLDRHDAMAQRMIDRYGGRFVKGTGDGLLATFDGPARGIRCARELVHAAAQLDIPVRAGVHTGEVEVRGDDVAGIAVHIGARVASVADAGEVLVSRTVRDLVSGSGIAFQDRGEHRLKGVDEAWQLFEVVSV